MTSRFDYLFKGFTEHLSYPCEGYLDYITPSDINSIVLSHLSVHFNGLQNKIIWDMFAGIGTDSIRLAKTAGRVICTEINQETFACWKKNTAPYVNIEIHCKDCSVFRPNNFQPDLIYFDPPWGENYRSGVPFSFDEVKIGELTVPELFTNLRETYPEAKFIVKTPFLCDFEKIVQEDDIKCILSFSRQKLKYVIC